MIDAVGDAKRSFFVRVVIHPLILNEFCGSESGIGIVVHRVMLALGSENTLRKRKQTTVYVRLVCSR